MRITVSYAQTLDGRIATRTGDSQWIGGPQSLRLAHQLRAEHDAVLVGVGTVVADDPRLTTRLVEGRSPLRVIADSGLRIPLGANVLRDRQARTLLVTTPSAHPNRRRELAAQGAEVVVVGAEAHGRVDLHQLVRLLEERGIGSLLVEGGAGIITSMVAGRLVDRLVICIAPLLLGRGIEAIGDLGIARLRDAINLANATVTPCGDDLIFDAEIAAVTVA